MRRRPEGITPRSRRLDMIGALATSPRGAGMRAWVNLLSRLSASVVEKYMREHVDVLVQGGDPYAGLLSACALAARGQRVLLHFTDSMEVTNDLYETNAHRLVHLPLAVQTWLSAWFSIGEAGSAAPTGLLESLCNATRSYIDPFGVPLIRVYVDGDLQPDRGICRGFRDSHIFWPQPARTAGHAAASELAIYHRYVGRRLPRLHLVRSEMRIAFVCARHVLLTSPVGGYDDVPWRCTVGRVGAGRSSLSSTDLSDSVTRIRDLSDAMSPPPGFV